MKETRRNVLWKASALSALGLGATATGATADDCSDYPDWDADTAYTGGDRVVFEGDLYEAEWWSQGTEPDEEEGAWTLVGPCENGGGMDGPQAAFSVSPAVPEPGEDVEFDASESDGEIESYEWEFGDGETADGEVVEHAFDDDGEYEVELTVEDDDGETDTATEELSVVDRDTGPADKRVVSYYMQWAQYERDYYPEDIPYDDITHLQYAFMRPEEDGSIEIVGDDHEARLLFPDEAGYGHEDSFEGIVDEHDDVVFLISIGGWGDSEYFSDAAHTQENRERFASDAVEILRETGFDGIDIDWEYPGFEGEEGNVVRPDEDHENYALLLEECRKQLDEAEDEDGKRYWLTAAHSANVEHNEDFDHETLQEHLDFVSLMTFDYHGGFSEYTAHHSPLHQNDDDPHDYADDWYASYALEWWVDQGWDPDDLNMAVPFYGRSFAGIDPPEDDFGTGEDDGLFQEFEDTGDGSFPDPDPEGGSSVSGIYEYWDLAGEIRGDAESQVDLSEEGWETTIDEEAVTAWSYNPDETVPASPGEGWGENEGLMISHETTETVEQKMEWVKDNDYGGTMLWALSHDTPDHELLSALSETLLE
ncbi:glycosyl hydrolase family 18 protein [Natrarchaeobius oligotrophus]|uniref:PKD domain-containing protein n=1 Tax=Natrarchaeobius chitinivorans TaxID=1679083 RepID=A0A3N6M9T6_NATCH|nr:glycosyl hydrolase family 18 protein [Natrarchaeobius chitinivorans]RQG99207.1 PKD domain-containing protein [Natrarchaeobius chitinivorans]